MTRRTVTVDAFPESAGRHSGGAIVVVDVIRATTTAVTAVALGRRCIPVKSVAAAVTLRAALASALLVGELGGETPDGFDLGNSPATIADRTDVERPIVLLSSSGTQLMDAARGAAAVYVACFRNAEATARHLIGRHDRVAVIGAGSRGEFRREDQLCCAWIAGALLAAGYAAGTARTQDLVARWRDAPAAACAHGRSGQYLRRTGQQADLDFVLAHVNDLDLVCTLADGEVAGVDAPRMAAAGGRRP